MAILKEYQFVTKFSPSLTFTCGEGKQTVSSQGKVTESALKSLILYMNIKCLSKVLLHHACRRSFT